VSGSIDQVEPRRLVPHADAERILRNAGYSPQQIEDTLRDVPDPIDSERDAEALFRHGISVGGLMDRMGGSP
jgi:hypothetical protein